ncbi:hypothetical protein LCGC14_1281880 [marine sediment metagenome]|uniref:Uncharacterized protein n=1 Tax=marine sediment metagenome TaxID=412755 RepID=A0A0F9NBI4_9ZZZZ
MTEPEATQFIEYVLKGLWPTWKPTDIELGLWLWKLKSFDYYKAEVEVKNWLCETLFPTKSPQIGKLLTYLSAHKAGDHKRKEDDRFIKDPNKLYGNEARDLAFANILNGPDTPGRRWLVVYLEDKYPCKPMLPKMKTVETLSKR